MDCLHATVVCWQFQLWSLFDVYVGSPFYRLLARLFVDVSLTVRGLSAA